MRSESSRECLNPRSGQDHGPTGDSQVRVLGDVTVQSRQPGSEVRSGVTTSKVWVKVSWKLSRYGHLGPGFECKSLSPWSRRVT